MRNASVLLIGLLLCARLAIGGESGRLIPTYDAIEDVGCLMTPAHEIELEGSSTSGTAVLAVTVFHEGRLLEKGQPVRILLTLAGELPLFATDQFPRLQTLASDGRRREFSEARLPDTQTIQLESTRMELWLTREDLRWLAKSDQLSCRAGLYDFQLPAELLADLRELAGRI